jgi:hypothetical protein
MIKSIREKQSRDIRYPDPYTRVEIDLTGPEGNAFVLLGYAKRWSLQLGLDSNMVQEEMKSGDYENLLNVIEKYFGKCVTLYR